jgi:inositol-1,4,5-trisphosphate 5-phosphatase
MPSTRRPEPPPVRGSQRARTLDFDGHNSSTNLPQGGHQNPMPRRMIAPLHPGHASQILNSDNIRGEPLNDLRRSGSSASTRSLPYRASNTLPPPRNLQYGSSTTTTIGSKPQVLRKPAPPPIPNKKASLLSKAPSPGPPSQQRYRDEPLQPSSSSVRRAMAPPPSMARKPVQNFMDDDEKPALPPRQGSNDGSSRGVRGGRGLLDDDEPEDLGRLGEWEVLRPVR